MACIRRRERVRHRRRREPRRHHRRSRRGRYPHREVGATVDPFAEPADVTAISGPLTADQIAALPGLLSQASTKLRGWGLERGIDIDALIAGDELRTEIAKQHVANAVKRAELRPEGFTEVHFAIHEYRETHPRRKRANDGQG